MLGGFAEGLADADQGQEATIVVNLPADATLTIGDAPTVSTSTERTFVSPALESGKDYVYVLKARIKAKGGVQTVTRQITVRAGETTHVRLDRATSSSREVASK